MRRRTRLVLLAAAAGLIVPTAINSSAASAVDQDLALSATSGAAGVEVTATSASCDLSETETGFSYLSVRLLSGTGADEVLAGLAAAFEDQDATFVIPDWIEPTDPAVVEASCITFDFSGEEPTSTIFTYDPIPFDVEASPGTPVQARTYSRTSLQAGQAFSVDGSGCFLDDAEAAFTEVAQGSDLSFRTAENFVASGGTDIDGDSSFSVPAALSNGGLEISVFQTGSNRPEVGEIIETPTDIPAGTYTSISYCSNDEGVNLVYEPELLEVTGDAPFGDIDLTVPAESRTATLAGGTCTSGDVELELLATDIDQEFGDEPLLQRPTAGSAARAQSPAAVSALQGSAGPAAQANDAWVRSRSAASGSRALADEDYLSAVVTPEADGAWSVSDDVSFDNGVVEGYAWCGDPLADGFIYDPRADVVSVTEVPPTVPTTVPTTVPAPVPADAVSGTPTYAG